MKTYDAVLPELGKARVSVFHQCPSFACGSVGTTGCHARWWAEPSGAGWTFMWSDEEPRARLLLEAAVVAVIGPTIGQLVAYSQDEAAEGPQ